MLDEKWNRHLEAARRSGKDYACGKKIDYKSEASADHAAKAMSKRYAPKELESYPCPFCNGWHIGRKMSEEELSEGD